MFVRNFYNILAIGGFGAFSTVSSPASAFSDIFADSYADGSLSLKRLNGTIDKSPTYSQSTSQMGLIPRDRIGLYSDTQFTSGTGLGIAFGSGDTPPTMDDYKLETPFGSSIIGNSVSSSNVQVTNLRYDSNTGKFKADVSVTIANKSSNAITINEFAIGCYYYMLYRAVLASSLTIAANSSAVMTYTVEVEVP